MLDALSLCLLLGSILLPSKEKKETACFYFCFLLQYTITTTLDSPFPPAVPPERKKKIEIHSKINTHPNSHSRV
jgi:hypothetical protein